MGHSTKARSVGRVRAGIIIITSILALAALPATAGTIKLAWDPVSHPDMAGYRVYYGPSSGNYPEMQDTGLTTQATLPSLSDCTTYYIAVKAFTTQGLESAVFSNEISGWARPSLTAATPSALMRGQAASLVIDGANFSAGASVNFSNPGISVQSVNVIGCNQISVDVSVSAGASLGASDVQVTDSNGIVGTGSGLVTVQADSTAPVISSLQAQPVGSTTATLTWTTDEPADGQAFFRPQGETVWQSTALASSPTTSHSADLNGLIPDTTYEYYVASSDTDGNTTTASVSTFTTSTNGFTYLRFEAEAAPISAPAETGSDGNAFTGEFIRLAAGTSSGSTSSPAGSWDMGVNLPSTGTWYFWYRMYGVSNNRNAWFEGVDGGSLASISTSGNNNWQWVEGRSFSLSAGQHTLTLGGSEAEARLDRLLVTDDPAFQPNEIPGGDNSEPSAVTAGAAAADDSQVDLSWTNPGNSDLDRVVVRFRTDGVDPVSPVDGQSLIDRNANPGGAESVSHTGLTNGVAVHYSIFAIDDAGNVSNRVSLTAIPDVQATSPAQVQNLRRADTQ